MVRRPHGRIKPPIAAGREVKGRGFGPQITQIDADIILISGNTVRRGKENTAKRVLGWYNGVIWAEPSGFARSQIGMNAPSVYSRWTYLAIPVAWVVAAVASWRHPGDEYGMFFVGGSAPALPVIVGLDWIGLSPSGSMDVICLTAIAIGLALMLALTALAAWLRVPLLPVAALWVAGASALVWFLLASYPSYERAMGKNGSLTAYVSSASNMALVGALICCLIATAVWRGVARFQKRKT